MTLPQVTPDENCVSWLVGTGWWGRGRPSDGNWSTRQLTSTLKSPQPFRNSEMFLWHSMSFFGSWKNYTHTVKSPKALGLSAHTQDHLITEVVSVRTQSRSRRCRYTWRRQARRSSRSTLPVSINSKETFYIYFLFPVEVMGSARLYFSYCLTPNQIHGSIDGMFTTKTWTEELGISCLYCEVELPTLVFTHDNTLGQGPTGEVG